MWICGECGEDSEDEFSVCWSCGTGQDGSAASEDFLPAEDADAELDPSAREEDRYEEGANPTIPGESSMAGKEPLATFTQKTAHGPIRIELFDKYMMDHMPPGTAAGVGSGVDLSTAIPYRQISHLEHLRGETFSVAIYFAGMERRIYGSEANIAALAQRLSGLIG